MSSIIIFVINDSLAQLVEHLTLNQQVPGSSPGWVTNEFKALQIFCKAFLLFAVKIVVNLKYSIYFHLKYYPLFELFYFEIFEEHERKRFESLYYLHDPLHQRQ